jgi:hypothetical protein
VRALQARGSSVRGRVLEALWKAQSLDTQRTRAPDLADLYRCAIWRAVWFGVPHTTELGTIGRPALAGPKAGTRRVRKAS